MGSLIETFGIEIGELMVLADIGLGAGVTTTGSVVTRVGRLNEVDEDSQRTYDQGGDNKNNVLLALTENVILEYLIVPYIYGLLGPDSM